MKDHILTPIEDYRDLFNCLYRVQYHRLHHNPTLLCLASLTIVFVSSSTDGLFYVPLIWLHFCLGSLLGPPVSLNLEQMTGRHDIPTP